MNFEKSKTFQYLQKRAADIGYFLIDAGPEIRNEHKKIQCIRPEERSDYPEIYVSVSYHDPDEHDTGYYYFLVKTVLPTLTFYKDGDGAENSKLMQEWLSIMAFANDLSMARFLEEEI